MLLEMSRKLGSLRAALGAAADIFTASYWLWDRIQGRHMGVGIAAGGGGAAVPGHVPVTHPL